MNNSCRKCGAVDSYEEKSGLLGTTIECSKCLENGKFTPDMMSSSEYESFKNTANPRCPNSQCDNHKNPPHPKKAFIISVVEEGFMGKIFKSEAYGIVSCKKCGEIIGVGGKG